jgi:hypothetical protein
MPGFLLHITAMATCSHAGQITIQPGSSRVLVSNQPAATVKDLTTVVGCTFTNLSGAPQPCVSVRWLQPATRVFVDGQAVLLSTSTGLCLNAVQGPQGAPIITGTQSRVSGT